MKKPAKMSMAKFEKMDMARDKKMGVKENSKRDLRIDKAEMKAMKSKMKGK